MRSFQLLNIFSLDILSPPGDIDVCSRGDEAWAADGSKSEFRVCWPELQSRVVWSEDNGLKDWGEGFISFDRVEDDDGDSVMGDLRSFAPLLKPNRGALE